MCQTESQGAAQSQQTLFLLGNIVVTEHMLIALVENEQTLEQFLWRHQMGDWGIVNEEEWIDNYQSVQDGARILSAYRLANGTEFWVITESDRSITTAMLPFEY